MPVFRSLPLRLLVGPVLCLLAGCSPAGPPAGLPTASPTSAPLRASPTSTAAAPPTVPAPLTLAAATPGASPLPLLQPPTPGASPLPPLQPPTPAPTLTLARPPCWEQGGRKVDGLLETELLRQPLEYLVYLPPCYDEQPERRYPVLYLIHGQSYNQDQWDRLGADEAMDRLVASGELPPFLIVMPRDRVWTQPSEDPFGQAVIEVLIPLVDRVYRTLPERTYRAVGGLSRGGGWAVHFGLNYPHLFGALGGHSPAVFHEDTGRLRLLLSETPVESLPRIYLDIGERDRPEILRSALWLEELLTGLNIPHSWRLFTGYHEEAYWSAHVESYLRWYAQEWQVDL